MNRSAPNWAVFWPVKMGKMKGLERGREGEGGREGDRQAGREGERERGREGESERERARAVVEGKLLRFV